jgi:hypothetical protein
VRFWVAAYVPSIEFMKNLDSKSSEVSSFAAEMVCKRKHSIYSSIISSNYVFKGLAFETLGPWCKETVDFSLMSSETDLSRNQAIQNHEIKEIPFREDFPCHSTWKRCKHSGHFSRFRNIIENFCIIKRKCYVIMLLI